MEFIYNKDDFSLTESPKSFNSIRNLANSNPSVHQKVECKVHQANLMINNGLLAFHKLMKVAKFFAILLVVAILCVAAYGYGSKGNHKRLHRVDGSHPESSKKLNCNKPFWQCKIDDKTLNHTHVELKCTYAPWKKDKDHSDDVLPHQTQESSSFGFNKVSYVKHNTWFNNTDQRLLNFVKPEHVLGKVNGTELEHHHGHYRPLFLTINDHAFLLYPPPPISPRLCKWIFCMSMILSHTLLAIFIICHCCDRHRRRLSEMINNHFSQETDGILIVVSEDCKSIKALVPTACPAPCQVAPPMNVPLPLTASYPAFSNENQPLARELPEVKKQKKMKYILVEDNSPEQSVMLSVKEDR